MYKIQVSILNYNYGKYLPYAIESVMNQELKPRRVVIYDDCSDDNSMKVINRIQEKFKSVELLQSPYNWGNCASRNAILNNIPLDINAHCFLDADDIMPPNYLSSLMAKMLSEGANIVYTDMQLFGVSDNVVKFPEWNELFFRVQNLIHSASMVKCPIVARFDEDIIRGFEDYEWFINMISKGAKAVKCNDTMLWYRRGHQSSLQRDIQTGGTEISERQIKAKYPTYFLKGA